MPIMTLNGPVCRKDLGITLSHEHLLIDLSCQYATPQNTGKYMLGTQKVQSEHRSQLLTNPYLMVDNLILDSLDDAISEINLFKKAGGRTIVDCTPLGIGRNPEKLSLIAAATGMNLILGCGYYTYDTHPHALKEQPWELIRDKMLRDLLDGIGESKIKAGIIGEIGTSKDIHPDEFKVLKAAAHASVITGAAIQVHTYPWAENGIAVTDFLLDNRVLPEKIVICHTDVVLKKDYLVQLLERGIWLQFDNFGKEFKLDVAVDGFAGGSFASDVSRVEMLKFLLEGGYKKQLLITTDICLKCLLKKYGGKGYAYVPVNIINMLQQHGIPREMAVETLLIKNPAIMLDKK